MTNTHSFRKLITGAGAAAMLAGGTLSAGDIGKAIIDDKVPIESWTLCDVFDMNTLYESDGFIRDVSLNGRYHGQYITQTEEQGATSNGYNEWQHRRFRLGVDIEFAGNLTLKTSANISNGSGSPGTGLTRGPFFDNWDEFYIDWEPNDNFYVQVGKQKQKITREFSTSSKKILTVERSQITNEVADQKPWGVTVGFETAGISQEVGAWVTGAYQSGFGNYANFNSRGALTYRANTPITEATDLFFDYAYTNNSSGTANGRGNAAVGFDSAYNNVFAVGTESEWGNFALVTDLIFATGRETQGATAGGPAIPAGNDTWGVVVLPTYDITDKLQFVTKYAFMDEGRNQRTQRFNVRQNVQNYHTLYAGFNYYICENNLKLMLGYEYATGEQFGTGTDIDSNTWMFAVRTYF